MQAIRQNPEKLLPKCIICNKSIENQERYGYSPSPMMNSYIIPINCGDILHPQWDTVLKKWFKLPISKSFAQK